MAVWRERETDHWNIWPNRFTPAGGWGTAGLLENYDGEAARARVAADAAGNVMAVWPQGSAVFSILARRFTPTTGWGPIDLLESDERGHAGSQEVAMDSQGNAMVVWSQDDGTRSNVWANRFTPDGGWGTAALIGSNAKDGQWPAVAMDPQGSAIAIWAEGNFAPPEDTSLFARRFTPTGGWGTIELIEGLTASARFPEVAMDGRGNAVAVWPSFHGAVDPWRSDIWTNRFTPEDGWGAMRLLQNHTWPDAVGPPWLMPSVAMNPAGNAVAVWPQSSNGFSFDAYANHFR